MADFGIQTFRPNGSVAIDSTNKAGVYIESMTIGPGQSGSKVYTDIPAGYLYHLVVKTETSQYSPEAHTFTVGDDGAGRAKLTWSAYTYNYTASTTVLVFARRTNSPAGSFGAVVLNSEGDYLADLKYSVPQYTGRKEINWQQDRVYNPYVNQGILYKCKYSGDNYNVTNKLFFLHLPDSTQTDFWYALDPYEGVYQEPTVYVYSPGGASIPGVYGLTWPSMHEFTLGSPVSSGSSFGLQYFNASGALTYDSAAENLALKETTTITTMALQEYQFDTSKVVQIPVSFSGAWGVLAPFHRQQIAKDYDNYDRTTTEFWLSLYQRRGNTLYYKVLLVAGYKGGLFDGTYGRSEGTPRGGGVMIADLSQLNPPPSIIYSGFY